jgi:hypothetical protein
MKTKILLFATISTLAVITYSCKKDDKMVPVQFLLTDNPTELDAVNVHIKGMQVKMSNQTWIDINTKDTTVNLLDFQNGVTEVMAQDTIPAGVLQEVRFILGTDNTVETNGTTYDLVTPSAAESGLKVKIDKSLNESLNTFVLDFDAAQSVREENGGYKLYPVIRLK